MREDISPAACGVQTSIEQSELGGIQLSCKAGGKCQKAFDSWPWESLLRKISITMQVENV